MGKVEEVYISKVQQVQGLLQSAASRAGFNSASFENIFDEILTRTQTRESVNAGAEIAVATAYSVGTVKSCTKTSQYDSIICSAAQKYDLDPNLIKAVIQVESSFRKDAVSRCGAMGLMQLMPGTAKDLNVTDAFDPVQNINGGAAYIRKQLDRFGDIRLALAAYNTGPGRIRSLNITNPDDPSEYEKISKGVRGYVEKVMTYFNKFSA